MYCSIFLFIGLLLVVFVVFVFVVLQVCDVLCVIGGEVVFVGEYLFMVSIQGIFDGDLDYDCYFCGGIFILFLWVLMVVYCVQGEVFGGIVVVGKVMILFIDVVL